MAKYRISSADGRSYEITAPDDAGEVEIQSYAAQQLAQQQQANRGFAAEKFALPPPERKSGQVMLIPIRNDNGGVSWKTRAELGIPADLSGVPQGREAARAWRSPPHPFISANGSQGTEVGPLLYRAAAAPASPSPTRGTQRPVSQAGAPQQVYGDLSNFEPTNHKSRNGAGILANYGHWFGGTGKPQDVEFSTANVSDLKDIIRDSAAGKLQGTFRSAINESFVKGGLPIPIDTPARINTGGIVIGRDMARLRGWITAKDGKWQFDGYATGTPERFDFNDDPSRGFLQNTGTKIMGAAGHAIGAADFDANYVGSIGLKAGGNIRQ